MIWACIFCWPVLLVIANPVLWLVIQGAWLWIILADWKKIKEHRAPPSLQAIESQTQSADTPSLSMVTISVVWFFGWPAALLAWSPRFEQTSTFFLFLIVAGSLIWFFSCGAVLGAAEKRWPAVAVTRKALVFLFDMLRILKIFAS